MALTDFSALAQFRRLVDLDFDLPRINIQDSVSRRQGLDLRHLGKAIDFFIRVELERMTPSHMLIARQQMYASAPLNMDDMVLRLEVENKLLGAESSIQKYSKGVIGLENIVRPLMDLAYLDSIARSYPYEQGREALDKLLGSRIETESTRDELLQHMRKCKNYLPEVKKSLITGPAFGKIGAEIGGADADLIVDGVLYDVKFFQKAYPNKLLDGLYQLLGYAYLNKIEDNHNGVIHSVGFIFPRQCAVKVFPLKELSAHAEPMAKAAGVKKLAELYGIALRKQVEGRANSAQSC